MVKVHHTSSLIEKRKKRIRAKLHGTQERPRVSVFRSSEYIYLQAIDDDKATTVAAASDKEVKEKMPKMKRAEAVAVLLAEKLNKLGVKKAIFDRGGYQYYGRVQAVAEALRKAGIQV